MKVFKFIVVVITCFFIGIMSVLIMHRAEDNNKEYNRCKSVGGSVMRDTKGQYVCAKYERV